MSTDLKRYSAESQKLALYMFDNIRLNDQETITVVLDKKSE